MSYDYTNKIIELFENKQKLKDAVIKDLEVNAIVNTLIMTIGYAGLFITISNNEDYSDFTNKGLRYSYIIFILISTLCSSWAVMITFFQLLLFLRTHTSEDSLRHSMDGIHTFFYNFKLLQIGIIFLLIAICTYIFITYDIVLGIIVSVIIVLFLICVGVYKYKYTITLNHIYNERNNPNFTIV